jgi:hypothetical protein
MFLTMIHGYNNVQYIQENIFLHLHSHTPTAKHRRRDRLWWRLKLMWIRLLPPDWQNVPPLSFTYISILPFIFSRFHLYNWEHPFAHLLPCTVRIPFLYVKAHTLRYSKYFVLSVFYPYTIPVCVALPVFCASFGAKNLENTDVHLKLFDISLWA